MRRGDLWTLSDTEAVVVIGSNRLAENDFPVTYVLPLHAVAPNGLEPPFVVKLTPTATGLAVPTWAHPYALRTVAVADLKQKLGLLNDKAIRQVDGALRDLLQL